MDINLKHLTVTKAHEHLIKKDFSVRELTAAYKAEIEKKNPDMNAYLEVFDDLEKQSDLAQEKFKTGEATLLTGIPIAVKDNILIKGKIASAASNILRHYRAVYDATSIVKLKDVGAVFLGRTNMDEFAMGGSTENSAFGPVKNPHDLERVAGGSSGGSAAAVAMDAALLALGSDTGGSVRQPASLCGIVGMKPSYGAVSRSGLIAMASSLDQIGTFGKTVEDAEILFDAICGKDHLDSTSVDLEERALSKKVLGIPKDSIPESIDKEVLENFDASIKKLIALGWEVKDISLPHLRYSLAAYYIVMPAEASSNLARFDGVRYGFHKDGKNLIDDYVQTRGTGFGREVRRRIMLGTYVLSSGYYDAYYSKASAVRSLIAGDFEKAVNDVDIIMTPTSPTPAFNIGEKSADPLSMYLADIFTVSANLAGIPAISVPSGTAERAGKHLPLGIQLMAPYGADKELFRIAKEFEANK